MDFAWEETGILPKVGSLFLAGRNDQIILISQCQIMLVRRSIYDTYSTYP